MWAWRYQISRCENPGYPPSEYAGIVVLRLPDDATAPQVVKSLEGFGVRGSRRTT
jgi:hypothetical protein